MAQTQEKSQRGRRSLKDKLALLNADLKKVDTFEVGGVRFKSQVILKALNNLKYEAILVKAGISSNQEIPVEHRVLLELLISKY